MKFPPQSGPERGAITRVLAPLANVAGLPSISLPLYMSDSGLPIGVEIDGAIDQDELVLQLSAQLERAAPWSERKPPIYVSEI